jgi:fructan beta-fructosidase
MVTMCRIAFARGIRLFICVCALLLTGSSLVALAQDHSTYQEPFRPQYHYSAPFGWINDPNGMVYYKGLYHVFYQYNPKDIVLGPQHWGHASSPDLFHWTNLPIALYPDDIGGPIWSGCVVVDANNTSGLVPGGGLVALFTYQDQSQAVAYSHDDGLTWTKYSGNPVIPALAKDFRDPKVFWHAPTSRWVMALAAGLELQFWTSTDLLHWEHRSSFGGGLPGGVWEVPDLMPMPVDGQTKWLLLASVSQGAPAGGPGIRYFVGDFDGETFTDQSGSAPLWMDYGPDNYAGTTWDNAPDGRHTYIGWMSSWVYAAYTPTTPWRGALTLPRDLSLKQTPYGWRLVQTPVPEVKALRTNLGVWDNAQVTGEMPLDGVHSRQLEIIADLVPGTAARAGLELQTGGATPTRIVWNAAQKQLLVSRSTQTSQGAIDGFTPAFGAPVALDNGHLRLHIFVDEESVEVFAQDGLLVISAQTFVEPPSDGVALYAEKGDLTVAHLEVYALARTWP